MKNSKTARTTLKEMHIPGMSVAIVHRDGPQWVTGLGLADVASNRAATAETLFRIGSTSKAFASLAILRLADQGKLSLEDPVHKLVPEVWFENQWETSDPIRVVHLLEHTTGWDDMHFREYAKEDATIGLLEAFDYDHHSRISRWRPGTRHAYCNSGPAVAAYIVEKITGQRFEDYVEQNFFQPIGMKTATYFQPAAELAAATLYHDDGRTVVPYWHIIYRPAGSINASAHRYGQLHPFLSESWQHQRHSSHSSSGYGSDGNCHQHLGGQRRIENGIWAQQLLDCARWLCLSRT